MSNFRIFFIATALYVSGCSPDPDIISTSGSMSVTGTLAYEVRDGYELASEPRRFIFPADHAAHPGYKNEWWYFTGNVTSENKRNFGYQFTIFRSAIAPVQPDSHSNWATNQIYLAHVAVSDLDTGEFYYDERFSRAALGLAGTTAEPFRVWLENWSMQGLDTVTSDNFDIQLNVVTGEFELQLTVKNTQPVVLHGNKGLSAKSTDPGNASYYYSYTRLHTRGSISINNENSLVTGESWFDHEWSTSALEPDQVGWDWFSLQLSDQSELMLFRLRHKDDADRHYYYGSLVQPDGKVVVMDGNDFVLHAMGTWRSDKTGIGYPAAWVIEIPARQARLDIKPGIAGQEMNTSFRYWEGSVAVGGKIDGREVTGKGYVEMTGYDA